MYWVLFVLFFVPFLFIVPVKVFGRKNIKKGQKYIVVCNHKSFFDPIILDLKLRRKIRFIAKKELWKGKEKSYLFDNVLGCIPVDRQKGLTMSTTKQVFSLLSQNKTVGIFPEGTRDNAGVSSDMQVKNGACMFAIKTKTPILPCYLANKQKAFKKNVLIIGKPFELSQFYDKKIDKDVLNAGGDVLVEQLNQIKNDYEKWFTEKQLVKKIKKQKKENV